MRSERRTYADSRQREKEIIQAGGMNVARVLVQENLLPTLDYIFSVKPPSFWTMLLFSYHRDFYVLQERFALMEPSPPSFVGEGRIILILENHSVLIALLEHIVHIWIWHHFQNVQLVTTVPSVHESSSFSWCSSHCLSGDIFIVLLTWISSIFPQPFSIFLFSLVRGLSLSHLFVFAWLYSCERREYLNPSCCRFAGQDGFYFRHLLSPLIHLIYILCHESECSCFLSCFFIRFSDPNSLSTRNVQQPHRASTSLVLHSVPRRVLLWPRRSRISDGTLCCWSFLCSWLCYKSSSCLE